jgi:hypothetical protein
MKSQPDSKRARHHSLTIVRKQEMSKKEETSKKRARNEQEMTEK